MYADYKSDVTLSPPAEQVESPPREQQFQVQLQGFAFVTA